MQVITFTTTKQTAAEYTENGIVRCVRCTVPTEEVVEEVGPAMPATKGAKISGKYMGGEFVATVAWVESSESGRPCDRSAARVWLTLAETLVMEDGRGYEKGDYLIIDCVKTRSNCEPQDRRYTDLKKHTVR